MAITRVLTSGLLASSLLGAAALAGPTGYKLVDRIGGPDGGWDYASVDTVNNRVLVARGTYVMSVDLATNTVTPAFAAAAGAHAAMAVNKGAQVLITNGAGNSVTIVDGKTGAPLAAIPTGKNPDAATFDANSGLVLVMDHTGGEVVLIDPAAMKSVGQIVIGGDLEAAAVDGAGKAYVNVEDTAEIVAIDIKARKVLARYKLKDCEGPTGLAYIAAEKAVMTTCDGVAQMISATTGKLIASVKIGDGADGVAFDPAQKLAFVSSGRSGDMSVISISGGKAVLVDTVKTQTSARTIALDPRSGRLYLPTARSAPRVPGATGNPGRIPGSFELLVAGK
jgi:YVTN family beta-propeller protein